MVFFRGGGTGVRGARRRGRQSLSQYAMLLRNLQGGVVAEHDQFI